MIRDAIRLFRGPDPRHRTLFLTTGLHLFTHLYHVALLPLYLPLVADLHLTGLDQATLLVTVMMIAYFLPSYGVGVLADRWSRKRMLWLGLLVNGLGFVGLAFARNFSEAVACMIVAGLGGSCFHPAATALVVGLYPRQSGRALGTLGMGASMGFFVGPFFAGWRGEAVGWRQAVLEMGLAGIVMAGLFAWLALEADGKAERAKRREKARSQPGSGIGSLAGAGSGSGSSSGAGIGAGVGDVSRPPLFANSLCLWLFVLTAVLITLRDFAGAGTATLSSLYLQKAFGESMEGAGRVLGLMFLASVISNPLVGYLSDRGQLRWAAGLLLISAFWLGLLPWVSRGAFPWVLMTYGFFFMSSYPVVEASLMQTIAPEARGRAFGLFITFGGLLGNLSHWAIGHVVARLGDAASEAMTYRPLFGGLAGLMLFALFGLPLIRYLQKAHARRMGVE